MIIPEKAVLRASRWCYQGVWAFVTQGLRVPEEPPQMPSAHDRDVKSFRPAEGFLRYLKLFFWIGLIAIDLALVVGWILICVWNVVVGLLITPLALAIIVLPDIVAYIAIHLRYDTTWYVLSDRSMRIRRGIWIIHETTITYDNIQNVSIRQGPVQRFFEISDVLVETAGGGAAVKQGDGSTVAGHHGLLEGISNAAEVRNLILAKWKDSKSAGLGDEAMGQNYPHTVQTAAIGSGFSSTEIRVLEQIRDIAVRIAGSS